MIDFIDKPRFEHPTHLDIRYDDNPAAADLISELALRNSENDFLSVTISGGEMALAMMMAGSIGDDAVSINLTTQRSFKYAKLVDSILHDMDEGQLYDHEVTSLTAPADYARELLEGHVTFVCDHPSLMAQVERDMQELVHPAHAAMAGQCALLGLASAERQHNQLVMSRIFAGID